MTPRLALLCPVGLYEFFPSGSSHFHSLPRPVVRTTFVAFAISGHVSAWGQSLLPPCPALRIFLSITARRLHCRGKSLPVLFFPSSFPSPYYISLAGRWTGLQGTGFCLTTFDSRLYAARAMRLWKRLKRLQMACTLACQQK